MGLVVGGVTENSKVLTAVKIDVPYIHIVQQGGEGHEPLKGGPAVGGEGVWGDGLEKSAAVQDLDLVIAELR